MSFLEISYELKANNMVIFHSGKQKDLDWIKHYPAAVRTDTLTL